MGYRWSIDDASVRSGFLRIASEQMAKAVLRADAVDDPPAARIHAARRHCKKLRALFRLVRSDFPAYAEANASIRDAASKLSRARDARVARQTLEALYAWAGLPAPEAPVEAAIDPESETAALATFRSEISQQMAAAEHWTIEEIDEETLSKDFARCYGKGVDAMQYCRKHPEAEPLHDWRKAVKYHTFQLRLLRAPLDTEAGRRIEQAELLATTLGRHHDLALLEEIARRSPEQIALDLDQAFVQ
ncbi:MAG: CHAD domain-containing protein, partial [Alphaproteobacteria bacterium]|nr:CHAD domain-containing protein [Alphaproteobacteria bacterium]